MLTEAEFDDLVCFTFHMHASFQSSYEVWILAQMQHSFIITAVKNFKACKN